MAESKSSTVQERKQRLIKLLHVGRRELGMDEDTYRQLIANVTRDPARNSSAQLTLQELDLVLDRMKAAGFKVRKGGHQRRQAEHPTARKVRSLWLTLRDRGALRDASETALNRWVLGETGIEQLAWLDDAQTHLVIERLKKWIKRLEAADHVQR